MSSFLSTDGPAYRFLDTATQLLLLNVLFIIGSIPIVTIGASAIALFDGVYAVRHDEFTAHRFLGTYKSHIALGLAIEATVVAEFAILAIGMWCVSHWGFIGQCLELLLAIVSALVVLSMPYLVALPAFHNMTFAQATKTALGACMENMARSIAMAVLFLFLMAIPLLAWRLYFVWVFFVFSLCAWFDYLCMRGIIVPNDKPEPSPPSSRKKQQRRR